MSVAQHVRALRVGDRVWSPYGHLFEYELPAGELLTITRVVGDKLVQLTNKRGERMRCFGGNYDIPVSWVTLMSSRGVSRLVEDRLNGAEG